MHTPDFRPGSLPSNSIRAETGWPFDLGVQDEVWQEISGDARSRGCAPLDLAILEGTITEQAYLTQLAATLGVPFSTDPPPPAESRNAADILALRSYATDGDGTRRCRVIAPDAALGRLLLRQHAEGRMPSIILTTRQALIDRALAADGPRIAHLAAMSLPEALSARHGPAPTRKERLAKGVRLAALAAGFLLLLVLAPMPMLVIAPLLLAPLFILAAIAVLTATIESWHLPPQPPEPDAANLPRYSVLVPLYRESNIIAAIVARLSVLSYPPERLEILLLVEVDDHDTLTAIRNTGLPAWFTVLPVPAGMPRTKPRALNAALPFCTGEYLVVFDAEDAPEPDQLLRAAARFAVAPPEVACLQARLGISNSYDGFLTRRFAIDYAALFDCVKAGSARAGWPVPLGGSSNHFRTAILRRAGGWDAWNVTEDADLGIRLARLGWLVDDLASTTWEEAPNTPAAWLNQRTRWMKGWMQTVSVQLRSPAAFIAALGPFRAMIVAAMAFAVLIGAALYPVFAAAVVLRLADPLPLGAGGTLLTLADAMLIFTLVMAVIVEIVPAAIALYRRRALNLLPYVLLAPITHFMVSLAVWRAMVDLVRRPFHWHKTMHGRAKRDGRLGSLER